MSDHTWVNTVKADRGPEDARAFHADIKGSNVLSLKAAVITYSAFLSMGNSSQRYLKESVDIVTVVMGISLLHQSEKHTYLNGAQNKIPKIQWLRMYFSSGKLGYLMGYLGRKFDTDTFLKSLLCSLSNWTLSAEHS